MIRLFFGRGTEAMRRILALIAMLICSISGCASGTLDRPCGPGYLGNIFVPQGYLRADFRNACYGHDACYATPCANRTACDDQFLDDMNCACECSSHPGLCRLRAKRWYWQVRLFGGTGYRQAQRNACCDCGKCSREGEPPVVVGEIP